MYAQVEGSLSDTSDVEATSKWPIICETDDHKPERSLEKARIEAAGGYSMMMMMMMTIIVIIVIIIVIMMMMIVMIIMMMMMMQSS